MPPVPRRTGLHGVLDFGSNLSPRTNARALESSVQEIMDQFSPLAAEYDIERPRDIQVRARKDLPALASGFDFEVIDDPKNTKRLGETIQRILNPSGKYAVTEKEWRPAARALEPFVREGNLRLLMNLGVANGPGIHRTNMRESIMGALWLEGLVTAPQAADFSESKNRRLMLRPLAEMAVASKKALPGKPFGVGGPQLARALPYTDIYAASVGLRSGPLGRGNAPLTPELFREGGLLTSISRMIRKDLRAENLAESGVSVRLARQNVPARARLIHDMLKANLSPADQNRIISMMDLDAKTYAEALKKDPAQVTSKLLAVLRARGTEYSDLALDPAERLGLADQIEEAVSVGAKKTKPTVTRLTETAVRQGRATSEEAMRELNRVVRKTPGLDPKILKGLGRVPFVLALAGVVSAGLLASGYSREEAA